jgi:UDP-N-acetylglucosamine 3-dehydrogenase
VTRVAVIGAGAMGRHHGRVYREIPDVELVGVADTRIEAATTVAALYGSHPYSDYRIMLRDAKPEAVSVVVPTNLHCEVTQAALEAGCHVLVEKPIASTFDEAESMMLAARKAGRVLAVGHIERFNPAVIELKRRLDDGQLGRAFQINARRLGPFPVRVRDVGVVIDLATHDLDIMRYLTGSEPVRLYAETKREIHTSNEDLLMGLIRFDNGIVGVLEINWLTPTKIRELTVTGERGMFRVDYLTQDLYFYENADASGTSWDALSMLRGVSEGAMTRFQVARIEPLYAQLAAFLQAAAGEPTGIVEGVDGIAALRLAHALIESSVRAMPVDLIEA